MSPPVPMSCRDPHVLNCLQRENSASVCHHIMRLLGTQDVPSKVKAQMKRGENFRSGSMTFQRNANVSVLPNPSVAMASSAIRLSHPGHANI